eukprot:g3631.t1
MILPSANHRIRDIKIHGAEDAVRRAQAGGDRLLFVINHPSHSDAQVLGDVQRRLGIRSCFMAAYDVFLRSRFCAWSMQKLGNFSIDREGSDRKAMAAAIKVLKEGRRGLNIFPEGNVYLSNDRVTPFLDGAAFIALKAEGALADGVPVKIVPVSLKLTHLTVPREAITMRLQKLAEDSGYIFPNGMKEDPMDAVLGLGHHIIRQLLSEHGYAAALRNSSELPLFDLLENFLEELVSKVEVALGCAVPAKGGMPARIGKIRSRIHQLRMTAGGAGDRSLHGLARRAILALRIHGYLTPYLTEKPSIDRYDETVERIAEDFYSKAMPRTGPRRALVHIHEPLEVGTFLADAGGDIRKAIPMLTRRIQETVQTGVDDLNALNDAPGDNPVHKAMRFELAELFGEHPLGDAPDVPFQFTEAEAALEQAVGLNPVDFKVRPADGAEPKILGFDAAGIVVKCGDRASIFKEGDAVYYAGDVTRPGSNAEFQLVDERIVGKRPASLDAATSAALPLTALTAWESLFHRLPIDFETPEKNTGKTLLIIGGAGGVGSIAIQLAKLAGLTVIATASRPESTEWCRGLGADHIINHRGDMPEQLHSLGFDSVDYIANYNDIDGAWQAMGVMIAPQGGIVLITEHKDHLDLGGPFKMKSVSIHWEFMFTRAMFGTEDMIEQHRILNRVSGLIDEGKIKATANDTLSPINAVNILEGHRRMESRIRNGIAVGLPLAALVLITVNSWSVLAAADDRPEPPETRPTCNEIVLASEVEWTPLNPDRGDKGPQAGTLWGNRGADEQSGFLIKFADGFSSPPHIHNITYRGVVMSGEVLNDDPAAGEMWMPAGSYWTQPAGEVHITAARGERNMAFLQIEAGPYLVQPAQQAYDNGERPVNMHAENIVWLDADESARITVPDDVDPDEGPEMTFLWGSRDTDRTGGALLRLPAGFEGELRSDATEFRAVVITGEPRLTLCGEEDTTLLPTGSYFGSAAGAAHLISSEEDCMIYIRSNGSFELIQSGNRETGNPRGFAFVTMDSQEAGEKAIDMLDGQKFDGRELKVNEAEDRRSSHPADRPARVSMKIPKQRPVDDRPIGKDGKRVRYKGI